MQSYYPLFGVKVLFERHSDGLIEIIPRNLLGRTSRNHGKLELG
jgi:hypothetical protein